MGNVMSDYFEIRLNHIVGHAINTELKKALGEKYLETFFISSNGTITNFDDPKELRALHSKINNVIGEITDYEFAKYIDYILRIGIPTKKPKQDTKTI